MRINERMVRSFPKIALFVYNPRQEMRKVLECAPRGEVAEWSNAPDSKSGIAVSVIEGSNPSLSARSKKRRRLAASFDFGLKLPAKKKLSNSVTKL